MYKWTALIIFTLYLIMLFSPFPKLIGRTHPSLAAFFYPPTFNFSGDYTKGAVYGFEIGKMKVDIADEFAQNNLSSISWNNYGSKHKNQLGNYILFDDVEEFFVWGKDREIWTGVIINENNVVVSLYFSNDILTAINLTKVNFEAI